MLTVQEAQQKGLDVCRALLGQEFLESNKSTAIATVGRIKGGVRCWISVLVKDKDPEAQTLPKYRCAECKVILQTGEILGARIWNEGGKRYSYD